MANSAVRQRKTKPTTAVSQSEDDQVTVRKITRADVEDDVDADADDDDDDEEDDDEYEEEDDYTPWVDILRVISFLFVASCALSYVVSGGESMWWGMKHRPDYLQAQYWKDKWQGPPPLLYLTLDELAEYDGTDADKPVYLSINGTIYDVSNGRHIYGPGGSYHYFSGCDASRGFVTGCFQQDRTQDTRGVERMYLPKDDAEVDAHWTAEELAALRVQELEDAKVSVHNALKHWVDFFARSKKYTKVGYLKRDRDWLEKEPLKELCAPAEDGRKKRKVPTKE